MGLHRFKPIPSGRMGTLWTIASIRDAALIEFGCMGHMLYSSVTLERTGVYDGCKLYSTHLEETDIAFGDTSRLDKTIENIIEKDSPKVIFLLPSSIPEVIGIDLKAVCESLQLKYPKVKLIPFGCGGFDVNQYRGVQEALLLLVKKLPVDIKKTDQPTFNIIGSCADIFRFQSDANEIVRIMDGSFGIKPVCVLSSDTSIEDIENMGSAHLNIVLRREGIPAAKYLEKRFGIPYIVGRPYGINGTLSWIDKIANISNLNLNTGFLQKEREDARKQLKPVMPSFFHIAKSHPDETVLSLGGHADVVSGILSFGCSELLLSKGTCWCDSPDMGSEEIPFFSEDEWIHAIQSHKKGFLMASGEALDWSGYNTDMQISNPDTKYRLHPYDPPFVGFRGAVNLVNLLINVTKED